MNENSEKSTVNVLNILLAVTGLLSFVLGFVLGICACKKFSKCCKGGKNGCSDFDADEYVRSLNLD
ncbi:MAG: hypothetical protein ACI4I1_06260 [Oscillospiraceae bacterium]